MRKFLWIIAVLFVAMGASIARADNFSYAFTGAGFFAGTDFTYISNGGHIQENYFYAPTTATDVLTTYADLGALNYFDLNGDLSTVVTPEPGTVVLYLTGIGLVGFVMRKRIAQGLPQAT